jgi:phosphohistidine swiveling domain-containing protein
MADVELSDLLKSQISLTEWLEQIQHKDAAMLRAEDGSKRPRLGVVHDIIGLPYDKPEYFDAVDIDSKNPRFSQILNDRGDELCAFRLVPTNSSLPKLRNRGKSIKEAYAWFLEQHIPLKDYKVEIVPHNEECIWATIFIVNQRGIFGEIINGGHHILTQGFHKEAKPCVFTYDFKDWKIVPENDDALTYLKSIVQLLLVKDEDKQAQLRNSLQADFEHNYIKGYFETTYSNAGTWFIDYSQKLGDLYDDVWPDLLNSATGLLAAGNTGCSGRATGPVRIVSVTDLHDTAFVFNPGSILVCEVTSPDYVPFMQKAAAIVTDQGGILSHAAIVARELGIPCIVGSDNATKVLTNNQIIEVDADKATVTISQQNE